MKFTLFQIAIIALQQTTKVAAADFTSIGGGADLASVTKVDISFDCPPQNQNVPNTMFTIQPSDSADVSSSPPNLVTTSVQDGVLSLAWNAEVASTASEGGVKIGLPAASLESVSIASQKTAQIFDGFTSLKEVEVKGQSTVTATIKSSTHHTDLEVEGQSTVKIVADAVNSASVSQQSEVYLQTSSAVEEFSVANQSNLNVNGGVVTGTVTSESNLKVTGDISSSVSVTEQSSIKANTISGAVTISSQSDASASSCDNVSASDDMSDCSVGSPPSVNVDVSEQSLTMSGTSSCGGIISLGGNTEPSVTVESSACSGNDCGGGGWGACSGPDCKNSGQISTLAMATTVGILFATAFLSI